jgi:uncharacterized membrane protein
MTYNDVMKKNISLISMVVILVLAGITHLVAPEVFMKAMPNYIPYHRFIIYFTGFTEILIAIGLLVPSLKKVSAYTLVAYFVAILPAHFHIALNGIEMFGYDSPYVLWGRTAFQLVFIYWAYSLSKQH